VTNIFTSGLGRRSLIRRGIGVGAIIGTSQLASPFIISARGEVPIKVGMINPLTGTLSALARTEVEGAQYGFDEINKKGGILGRPVQLLVEDSNNDVGTGVQKARKLFDRDNIDVLFGDVNSAISLALAQVSSQQGKLHIVTGGHSDAITGKDCHWNVFRVCNSTVMDASAIASVLMEKLGKKWFFMTPDYAYGHSVQEAFEKKLKAGGGTFDGVLAPLGTSDFSAYLIKAQAAQPDVLICLMGGQDQVNCLKQFVQFGLNKRMKLGGALFELEAIQASPPESRFGWWDMEWYWNQPNVPGVKVFADGIRAKTGNVATARHWMGYVACHSLALAAAKAKSLDGPALSRAMEGLELPAEIAMSTDRAYYRAGDHQLMSGVLVGEAQNPPAGGNKDDLFRVVTSVSGETAAGPIGDSGCTIKYPA
jgi:branched-chain amino acid transport system substrate-binding protein